ncbi:MAG: extracellular solute-binding protein [Herbinix sp.]|nr:extracellular solute-binding protein [Herbinix sp.]
MQQMKRILLLLTASLLVGLTGCSKSSTVEIRYAAWNLGTVEQNGLERQMIAEFMKENPKIKIVIDENFVTDYNQAMSASAENNILPDVFMYSNISTTDENNWSLDISDIVEYDSDWSNIPEIIKASTYVKGKIVAIPSGIYFYGYFCNNDVLKASGLADATSGITLDSFIRDVKEATAIEEGRIGLGDSSYICDWYPAATNDNYGWFTWDGGKFNLHSQEFRDGIRLTQELDQGKYTYALLNDSEKELLGGGSDWEGWNAGSIAFKFDGTWAQNDYSKLSYDISFIGMPGGRTCVVPDYLFLSKTTEHPEEAYQFAKFMSTYSEEGFSKRLELAKAQDLLVTTIPMVNNIDLIEQYFDLIKMKGIKEVYDNFYCNAYIETAKVLPGYAMARWNYETNITIGLTKNAKIGDVIAAACKGQVNIDDIAEQINYLANTSIQIYPQQLNN